MVKGQAYKALGKAEYIHQGFLSTEKEHVVRVRIREEKAWITIKGLTEGISRAEFEYGIPFEDALYMLNNLCEAPTLEKHRYLVTFEGYTWEVDEFHGENEGLVIAELELKSEDEEFPLPGWIGEEVTGDPKYYNANLVKNPYKNWKTS